MLKTFSIKPSMGIGVSLLVLGVILVLIVFAKAYQEYNQVTIDLPHNQDFMEAIASSSGLIMQLLFKLAYLGLALAAGSILIRYSIPIITSEGKEDKKN